MNSNLLDKLIVLREYYQTTKDTFRSRAYSNAIFSISNLQKEITDISHVKNLKGVGKSIFAKIDEYLTTGQIQKVQEVEDLLKSRIPKEKTIEIFGNIWGVGPVKAKTLWNKGYRNIQEIRANPSLLSTQQKAGLKYYDDLSEKIPRRRITVFQAVLRYILNKSLGKNTYKMAVAGSYRRGKLYSGDVDILLSTPDYLSDLERPGLKDIIDILKKIDIVTDILSVKNEKFMGIAHCPGSVNGHFRLDIEFLPEKEWGSGLLYFTGSKMSNIRMRKIAKNNGMVLNQHGLFKDGVRLPLTSEIDIYNALGMEYVIPKKR